MHRSSERGNAVVFILIAIALFAALAFTFMRSGQQGQGNLTAADAKFKAQQLANFFSNVEKGADKLRQRGCSENDISFAYTGSMSGDTFTDNMNHPTTAPVDHSCNVFDAAGGNVNMDVTLSDYQVPEDQIDGSAKHLYNHALFKQPINISDTPLPFNALSVALDFVKPEICKAYNEVMRNNVDLTIIEDLYVAGDVNATLKGKINFCYYKAPNHQNGGPLAEIIHVWIRY